MQASVTAGVTVEGTNRVIIIYNYLAIWVWVWGDTTGVARTDPLAVSVGEGWEGGGAGGEWGWVVGGSGDGGGRGESRGVTYRGFGSTHSLSP